MEMILQVVILEYSLMRMSNGKTVTITSSYSGADVSNYSVTDQSSTTGNIVPKVLTASFCI